MAYSLIMLGPPPQLQTKPRHRNIRQVRAELREIIISKKQYNCVITIVIYCISHCNRNNQHSGYIVTFLLKR